MNNTKCSTDRLGFAVCAALLGALTGCVGYVDQPQARGGYYQAPPPPPEEVYVQPPPAQVEVSDESAGVSIRTEDDFYAPLAAYGRWEVVGSYGRCWIPGRVEADWRPYCQGYWQRTDAGWYWASDEPWAWATYHYGRWDLSPEYGWYWVPQTQWAPAWVSWHRGGGYIGWAPLYPSARFARGGSVEVDVKVISPRAYVFVEERHFQEPVRPSTVVVNNTTIINNTVNITNIKVVNNTVINEGPTTSVIETASGRKVQALAVRDLRHTAEAGVVATQRSPASGGERKIQPPVRNEAQPAERKAVAAHAPPQVEKPAAAAYRSGEAAPKNLEAQTQKPKPALANAKSNPAVESSIKPDTRAEGNHPTAIREPTLQKADKRFEKNETPAKSSDKKMQGPAKERPAASNKNDPNTVDKNQENKAKE
jgi:uncharacterized protein DUF6600